MRAEGEGVLFPEWGETFDSGHLFAQITFAIRLRERAREMNILWNDTSHNDLD